MAATAAIAAAGAAIAANHGGKYQMKSWTKGDRVSQATYGNGTLVEVNEHHTVIEFDEHGRKVFSSKLVTLLASSEPAPKKTPRKRAVKKKTDGDVKDEKPAKAAKA